MSVRVQTEDFDIGAEIAALRKGNTKIGAIASFIGLVRDINEGDDVSVMTLEHYPGMTEKAISAIMEQARARWTLIDVLVIHRFGKLAVGAPIMMVATAAVHRGDAFLAADFLMDYLKSRAPFWKKEIGVDGEIWVASKAQDEAALKRW